MQLSKVTPEKMNNLSSPISIKEIDSIIKQRKSSPIKKNLSPGGFAGEFYQIFKKNLKPILFFFNQEIEEQSMLLWLPLECAIQERENKTKIHDVFSNLVSEVTYHHFREIYWSRRTTFIQHWRALYRGLDTRGGEHCDPSWRLATTLYPLAPSDTSLTIQSALTPPNAAQSITQLQQQLRGLILIM